MNAGQPYVEKNKYILGDAMTRSSKNNLRLKKSGTTTAPSAINENKRFKKASVITASTGEQQQQHQQ